MPDPQPIKVLACDSYGATRLGIASILAGEGMQVLDTVATIEECLASAAQEKVAVYIVGLNHGDPPVPTLIRELRQKHSRAGIVAYGAYTNPRAISVVYEAGANAYVLKSSGPDVLVEAIRTSAAGGIYWVPAIAEQVATFYTSGAHLSHPKHLLTAAEMKLFILLAQGVQLREAAQRLGIGERSAGNRSVTIRKKLGIERDEFSRTARDYDLL